MGNGQTEQREVEVGRERKNVRTRRSLRERSKSMVVDRIRLVVRISQAIHSRLVTSVQCGDILWSFLTFPPLLNMIEACESGAKEPHSHRRKGAGHHNHDAMMGSVLPWVSPHTRTLNLFSNR